jgi:hypothetical protein
MRTVSLTIIVIAFLGLLVYTNPTMDSYEQFIHQKIIQKTSKQHDINKAMGMFLGGLASSFVTKATDRQDYVFFSIYESGFGDDRIKAIGILKNFLLIQSPRVTQ